MEIHHSKHHRAYVNGFNAALEELREVEATGNVDKIVSLQSAIKFNGGGHINHEIFWRSLIPPSEQEGPQGKLKDEIVHTWGSLDTFIGKFNAAAAAVQGSGWGWLGFDPKTGTLRIATTANQDPLFPTTKLVPLLGVDVWEHAYYLQYKNVRPDYLREIWKVINWKEAAARFEAAAKGA
ncbi:hypothetical protein QBZ16_002476 [Prototheca wickerhamii]|uniref:Superoxide dismutase n=1 Tax=Prototheca wickerhamii TaxID=3111 RepID=A0AAD9IMF9_PROWI|nr:hypothetical protein QBZ16_002476 [Prototheca wickerhamii]